MEISALFKEEEKQKKIRHKNIKRKYIFNILSLITESLKKKN